MICFCCFLLFEQAAVPRANARVGLGHSFFATVTRPRRDDVSVEAEQRRVTFAAGNAAAAAKAAAASAEEVELVVDDGSDALAPPTAALNAVAAAPGAPAEPAAPGAPNREEAKVGARGRAHARARRVG